MIYLGVFKQLFQYFTAVIVLFTLTHLDRVSLSLVNGQLYIQVILQHLGHSFTNL